MTFKECVAGIIEMDGEAKAIQILSQTLVSKERKNLEALMTYKAAVSAIKRANEESMHKNGVIEALCNPEDFLEMLEEKDGDMRVDTEVQDEASTR